MLVRLHMWSLSDVPRTESYHKHPVPLALTSFLSLLSPHSLSPRCSKCIVDGSVGTGHNMISCSLHFDWVWFSIMISLSKFLCWGVRTTLIYGYKCLPHEACMVAYGTKKTSPPGGDLGQTHLGFLVSCFQSARCLHNRNLPSVSVKQQNTAVILYNV